MIKSEIHRGLIYAGETQLNNSIVIEQTGPLQLAIRAGVYTHTDGTQLILGSDEIINFLAHPDFDTDIKIEIGLLNGTPDLLVSQKYKWQLDFEPISGWVLLGFLVLGFRLMAGGTDLPDIYILSVLPGFPEGTTALDWKIQVG